MKLEEGRVYELDGKPWRCELVTDSRARLVPAWKEHKTIGQRTFDFTPKRKARNVSPNSLLSLWRNP